MSIDELNERFGIAPSLEFDLGAGGLTRARIRTPICIGEMYLQGAQVTRFDPTDERGLLFVSPRSRFESGKAIRGGIPICFPWFGDRAGVAGAPAHGFARTRTWDVRQAHQYTDGTVAIVLELREDDQTLDVFPHQFSASLIAHFSAALSVSLVVRNGSTEPMLFESALHTYLAVRDVEHVAISGLSGVEFIDKTRSGARATDSAGELRFSSETDRVYVNSPHAVEVADEKLNRRVRVEKEGSMSTVLWTPWTEKAGKLIDLQDAWRGFVCVEAGNIGENAVRLSAGESHAMKQVIFVSRL
jgi:D-hexose-6-phosphate mutarotase